MSAIEVIILFSFAAWIGRIWWDKRRGKNRTARNVAAVFVLIPAVAWTLFAPPAIMHFHANMEETLTRAPEMAKIVFADKCNLFRESESPEDETQYAAFAGRFFGPAISAKIYLPLAADGEKGVAVFSAFTVRRFLEDNFTGETWMTADGISVYADGELVKAQQTIFVSAGYENSDAVAVIEKIADSRQSRIVLTKGGETAEAKLSEGDICRFRKLRDLLRKNAAAPQEKTSA